MLTPDGAAAPLPPFADWLERTPPARIAQKREEAERAFHRVGITFAVYGEDGGTERLIPFDIVPRIIPADGVGAARARPAAARARAQPLPARHLPRPGDPQGRRDAAGARRSATRSTAARWRGWTCRAASTRTSPASTSCAPAQGEYYVLEDNLRVPVGRVVHAREPQDDDAALSRALRDAGRSARSSTTRTCCSRTCATVAPAGRGRSRPSPC